MAQHRSLCDVYACFDRSRIQKEVSLIDVKCIKMQNFFGALSVETRFFEKKKRGRGIIKKKIYRVLTKYICKLHFWRISKTIFIEIGCVKYSCGGGIKSIFSLVEMFRFADFFSFLRVSFFFFFANSKEREEEKKKKEIKHAILYLARFFSQCRCPFNGKSSLKPG